MAIVLKTDGTTETITGENSDGSLTLKQMQNAVGGYITTVPQEDDKIEIYADDEGLIKQREYNSLAHFEYGLQLVGDVLVCERGEVK